jgi:hypothetical protein
MGVVGNRHRAFQLAGGEHAVAVARSALRPITDDVRVAVAGDFAVERWIVCQPEPLLEDARLLPSVPLALIRLFCFRFAVRRFAVQQ